MGFRELAANVAKKTFTVIGNIPRDCTYRSKSSENPGYTPATGAVADPYTDYAVSMVFSSYRSDEEKYPGSNVPIIDFKAIVPQANLPTIPKMNDLVVKDGETLEVVKVRKDPADAIWSIYLRRP